MFLSHCTKDKAVVRPLAERSRQDGLKVWFDEWMPKPGESIPARRKWSRGKKVVLKLAEAV